MTKMSEATGALRKALASKDTEAIKTLRATYDSLLFTYNPNRPTGEERAFEFAMQEADSWVYPRKRCESGHHLDDCMRRCGVED